MAAMAATARCASPTAALRGSGCRPVSALRQGCSSPTGVDNHRFGQRRGWVSGAHLCCPRPLMLEACLDLDPDPDQVQLVRAFVQATLIEWDMAERIDDTTLVTSELVTNAILHARTPIRIVLQAPDGDLLRVEVIDDNPRTPVRAADEDGATTGRGLRVVAGAASNWGTDTEGTGKVVWAELGHRQPSDPDCVDLRGADSAEQALARMDHRRADREAT
ncbi:MAG: ATP-binding protein [Acidimicrobiales bacterium]